MKKRFGVMAALLVLSSTGAMAETIELDVKFDQPDVWIDDQGFSRVEQGGCLTLGAPGEPSLPVRVVNVLLPPDHRVVSVDVQATDLVRLPGYHVVYPAQPPRPLSLPGPFPFREPDSVIYSSSQPFPAEPARPAERQFLRGFALLGLQLRSVVFHPAAGKLEWAPVLRVRVQTEPDKTLTRYERIEYRGLQRDYDLVGPLVANPELLAAYPPKAAPRNPDYRYLVVTTQALSACTGTHTLNTLIQSKQARGISTRLETLETIRTGYSGPDDAAKVRAFVTDMYQNHGAEFVLIAGDADRSVVGGETQAPVVPVRDLWGDIGTGADQVPSDLYYAALDGNFNANGNATYGEPADQPDLQPELAVGRAPVDSCAEVANFVRKTLAYESSSASYLSRVYMVGEFLWGTGANETDWGKGYLEQIHYSSTADGLDTKGFSENSFFQVGTLYDRDLNPGNPPSEPFAEWSKSDILAVINGPQHIINHLGHSYTNYNMRLETGDIDSGMSNSLYFFEYSQGCYCGSFDNRLDDQMDKQTYWQDSFAEHMTLGNNGAFAVIMNTRYGLGGYSNYFHRLFWDDLFRNGQKRLGPMHDYSRRQLSGYVAGDDGMRWVFYEATLFGDPEMSLHTSGSAAAPTIGLPAEAPWFLAIENVDQPPPQTITLSNTGGGTLNWQASWNASWLQLQPQSGTAPTDITLTVNATGMTEGHYQDTITFTAPDATNSPQQMVIDFYVIKVPTAVAPYNAAVAPTVNGTIAAGEYAGASVIDMGTITGNAATAQLVHNGSTLFVTAEVDGDVDADDTDVVVLLVDTNGDGLWPTDPASTSEGEFDIFANGDFVFWPYYNSGSGQQTGQGEYTAGVQGSFGMNSGHRVAEMSFNLSTSRLQRQMGQSFRLFLFWLDYNATTQQHDLVAMWPFAIRDFDTSRYLATVVVGTQGDNLMVSPQNLQFRAIRNSSPTDPVQLTVGSTTANPLSFTLSAGASWLKLDRTSGTTPQVVLVSADPAGQTTGVKNTTLTVTAAGAQNSPLQIPVSFQVDEIPPAIGVQPAFLSFAYTQGGTPPAAQSLQVSNLGGGTLNWTATVQGSWIHLSTASGTAPSTVTVTPVVQGLAPGYQAGSILFSAPGAEPVAVSVSIEVTAQPRIVLSPVSIVKSDPAAGGPVEVEFQISNQERGAMDWTASEAASWITLSKTAGTYVTGHPSTVTVTLNPAGLSAGVQQADILIYAPAAVNSPQTLPVSWTLVEGAAIVATPDQLSFQGQVGGANPAAQILNISNGGPGALRFTLSCQPAWLGCNPASGAAPASVGVSVSIAGLAAGQHQGTVTITSPEALNSPLTVPVTLLLSEEPQNQPPPTPTQLSPAHEATVFEQQPELVVQNVVDPDGHTVTYNFEIFRRGETTVLQSLNDVAEGGNGITFVRPSQSLEAGFTYEWRVQAKDSLGATSAWSERWMFNVQGRQGGNGGCGCASSSALGGPAVPMAFLCLLLLRRLRLR